MKLWKVIDRVAFLATVFAGTLAAFAGGYGWAITAVVAGCIAAVGPIVNRIAAARLNRRLMSQLEARSLTPKQREHLVEALQGQPRMSIWVCHNRHEAEPSAFQRQVSEALEAAGHEAKYFGGMTNAQAGIEISGDPTPEKQLLMTALARAGIPFTNIVLTDDRSGHWGLAIWIGTKPSPEAK